MKEKLDILLRKVESLGLCQYSIDINREYLNYGEYELCLDTLAEHLYEDKIKIDEPTYELILSLIEQMKLSKEEYFYLKELTNS